MKKAVVVLGMLAATLLGSCGGGSEVLVNGFRFQPSQVRVPAGSVVRWRQQDNTTHTLTAGVPGRTSGLFDHRNFVQGDEFSFTFPDPGTYAYFCSIHTSMRGAVIVG